MELKALSLVIGYVKRGKTKAAESYMAEAVLDKHRIPFLVNVNKTLESLKKLLNSEHGIIGTVPGWP